MSEHNQKSEHYEKYDPKHVRIYLKDVLFILCISKTDMQRKVAGDPMCPRGYKTGPRSHDRRVWILQDVYDYSDYLTEQDMERTRLMDEDKAIVNNARFTLQDIKAPNNEFELNNIPLEECNFMQDKPNQLHVKEDS